MNKTTEAFLKDLQLLLKQYDASIQVHPFDCGQGVENKVTATVGIDQVTIVDDPGFVELCEETIQEAIDNEFT